MLYSTRGAQTHKTLVTNVVNTQDSQEQAPSGVGGASEGLKGGLKNQTCGVDSRSERVDSRSNRVDSQSERIYLVVAHAGDERAGVDERVVRRVRGGNGVQQPLDGPVVRHGLVRHNRRRGERGDDLAVITLFKLWHERNANGMFSGFRA
eukprot:8390812-Pyramimonas_sp.AAC.1